MNWDIRHGPTFAVVHLTLDQGERVRAQPNAMLSMSTGVEITIEAGGLSGKRGMFAGFKSMLSGEKYFTNVYSSTRDDQTLILAPPDLGDVMELTLTTDADAETDAETAAATDAEADADASATPAVDPANGSNGYYLTRGAYLASTEGAHVKVHYGGLKGVMAQKGLFLMHATGNGTVFCATRGALVKQTLAEGERIVVDNRYVVAFEDTIGFELVKATKGLKDAYFSGEGLVNRYTGPGTLYYQTRGKTDTGGFLSRIVDIAM